MNKFIAKTLVAISIFSSLTGCVTGGISVYGPVKTGNQDTMSGGGISGQSDAQDAQGTILTTLIGNRKPDEIIAMVKSYYQKKGLIPSVQNQQVGIVAAIGSNLDIAGIYLECSDLTQTQNIQEHYRIVTQVWSSEEGSNISVQVNGYADLVASDGNEKIKPTDCTSTNEFENGLLESLKK